MKFIKKNWKKLHLINITYHTKTLLTKKKIICYCVNKSVTKLDRKARMNQKKLINSLMNNSSFRRGKN